MPVLAVGLLVVAVGGALARPWGLPAWAAPAIAVALAVVAGGVAAELPHLLSSAGNGEVRGFGNGAIAANGLNNLPVALLSVRRVAHVSRVWPSLLGLNLGPMLVITGSLASLLWQASARTASVHVGPRVYSRVGFLVGVPAMAAVAVLVWLL